MAVAFCTDSTAFAKRWFSYVYEFATSGTAAIGGKSSPTLSKALLQQGDDTTSNAIISTFQSDAIFASFARKEMEDILSRDEEDGEKLAAGIRAAVEGGVLEADPPVEPVTKIDVAGKSADVVAGLIISRLGEEASKGCVLVLQGLSGTGKGTTVGKLQEKLPRAVCWSNGNVFRSLTLLAVSYCEAKAIPFGPEALTTAVLAELMGCLTFGKFDGKFDIHICGYGHDCYVSQVANTTLKEPRVGKNIPTVAKLTQGQVVKFAGGAAETMRLDGHNVLVEGRAQTLDYVRTPHRFELTLAEPLVIGERRAAQRMMAAALPKLSEEATAEEVKAALMTELTTMAA